MLGQATSGPLSGRRLARLDRYLDAAAHGLLKHDERARGLDVQVAFSGGVAHLTGSVAEPAELAQVRELIGQLAGVYAVWSRVRVAGREPVHVDVGCGATKQYDTSFGVDRRRTAAVDVLADLRLSLPFRAGTVDAVFAVHVLEHLIDFLPLVDECHRVLRPGGTLHLMSPWWGYVNAVADPTHVRLLDVQTVKGICERPDAPRWRPLHAACDGASVFGDLTPLPDDAPDLDPVELARFFD
jgi:SAM-dependent methyltransferase